MTECTQRGFAFEEHFSRRVVAEFSGDRLTTEGGALLLRQADRKMGLLRRVADCFTDTRQPERVDAREPVAAILLVPRLYAAPCAAAAGTAGNPVGRSPSRDDPAAAAENCRPGARDRAENLGLLQRCLSLETYVRCCLVGATLLNSRSVENATSRT